MKIYFNKNNLPHRSASDSSVNSEDRFICFESSNNSFEDTCKCSFENSNNSFEDTCKCRKFASTENETSNEYSSDYSMETRSVEKSLRPKKKVHFADNSLLTTIHFIIAWDYAYRAARISPWEMMARDSNRFRLKIRSLEPILSRVLSPEHRAKILETRMRAEET